MATAARRDGGDPVALRKRTKGPKASAARRGAAASAGTHANGLGGGNPDCPIRIQKAYR